MARGDRDPPFQGGSQPVPERPPESTKGRGAMQAVVVVIGGLAVLAALAWLLVPIFAGTGE